MKQKHEIVFVDKDEHLLKECLNVRYEVFQVEKGIPKNVDVDKYDCINNECEHFLIKYEKKSVGTVRCKLNFKNKEIKLERFCILSDYRRFGLGRLMLEFIENYYKNKGFKIIRLDSKFAVYGFYEKNGYKAASEVFIEAGIDHIKMEKKLNNANR